MPLEKLVRVARLLFIGVLIIFCFGAAGEICGSFFETTAAAFGSDFEDNKPEDIRSIIGDLKRAKGKSGNPENSMGLPVAVIVTEDNPRAMLGWDLKAGRLLWKIAPPISSEITLGGDLVVFQSGNDVAAHNLRDGSQAWRFEIEEGWDYHGADVRDNLAVISIGVGGQDTGSYANGRLIGRKASNGALLWDHKSGSGLLGEPSVYGDLVFAPWDRQKIAILDAKRGREIARLRAIDYTINFVEASEDGVYFGSAASGTIPSMLFRLNEDVATGKREGSTVFIPNLAPVPGDPCFKRDAFAKPISGRSAREKIRFFVKPTASHPTSIAMAQNMYYLLYWRYIIAFDSTRSQVQWTYRASGNIESLSAVKDGVLGIDSSGQLFFIQGKSGAVVWTQSIGQKVLAAAFDADGFNPSGQGKATNPLVGLKEIVWDKDNRMLPIRSYATFLLAAIPVPEVTRDLLQIYSDAATPKGLRDAVVRALEKRTIGAEYLVDALNMRYDFLEKTQPPPLAVMAPALVNMNERTAVPGLLTHLMNHETPVEHLNNIVVAIIALGDNTIVGGLEQFLTLYHADSSFLEHEDALVGAAEAILKFGEKKRAKEFVINIRDDSQTLPELKLALRRLIDPVAAAQAAQKAKAEVEAKIKAEADAATKAKVEAEKASRIPDALSRVEINQTIISHQQVFRPCVQSALAKMPTLQNIRLRFVITGQTGKSSDLRILPNNVPGLHDCLTTALEAVNFPRFRNLRQMATYTIRIQSRADYSPSPTQQPAPAEAPASGTPAAKPKELDDPDAFY